MKPILDVCCGSKMFYADKNNPNVMFCNNRIVELNILCNGEKLEIKPDMQVDFKNLPFDDESFYLVIFDPPHIRYGSEKSFMVQKYGKLDKEFKINLAKGFKECMRVLKTNGTLIFKWSETQIALSEILRCFDKEALLMQKSSKTSHFCVFIKEE